MKSFIEVCKNRAIAVLMLGHFTNDMFAGVLAIMYPILKLKFGLSNAEIGLVTLCYTSMVSLTQPIFGLVIDRKMRMWYPSVVILWGSVFVSLYGFAPTFAILMGCAAMAGLGSGAWHPMGATNVAVVTDPGHRNSSMSIYSVAGTLGYALGPIVTSVLLTMFGPEGTGFLVIPGVLASILIFRQMGAVAQARERRAALTATEASIH
ncbi:MAG: MFS transporter, partial [Chloroflexota bacterium]